MEPFSVGSVPSTRWQFGMASLQLAWRPLLTCIMVYLDLGSWGSFALQGMHKSMRPRDQQPLPNTNIVCYGCWASLWWWLWWPACARWKTIWHGIGSMDLAITAVLFHCVLGSMGQLCKAFPGLCVQGIIHYSPIYRVGKGAFLRVDEMSPFRRQQHGMVLFPWMWRPLLTCSVVHLGPWASFAKHSQVFGAKGLTRSNK